MTNATLQPLPGIDTLEDQECVHYWVIDTPSGPVSVGKCRECGEGREFKNYLDFYSSWDDDRNFSHVGAAIASVKGMDDVKEGLEEEG